MTDFNFGYYKALIVEDNDFVRFMVKKYLSEFGFQEINEAVNGAEGIEKLSKNPDIVVCDINMAPMNGFDFLKHVRALPAPANKIPIIFLTSNASADFVQKAIDMDIDAYLLKPVTSANLKAKMITLLTRAFL